MNDIKTDEELELKLELARLKLQLAEKRSEMSLIKINIALTKLRFYAKRWRPNKDVTPRL